MSLPACDAVMLQVPAPTIATVEPDTVQTPVLFDANDTSRPDDAVAVRSTVPA